MWCRGCADKVVQSNFRGGAEQFQRWCRAISEVVQCWWGSRGAYVHRWCRGAKTEVVQRWGAEVVVLRCRVGADEVQRC